MPRLVSEPPYSCPEWDKAIEHIEAGRRINDELRHWGSLWKERSSELEAELEASQNEVAALEQKLDEEREFTQELERKLELLLTQLPQKETP